MRTRSTRVLADATLHTVCFLLHLVFRNSLEIIILKPEEIDIIYLFIMMKTIVLKIFFLFIIVSIASGQDKNNTEMTCGENESLSLCGKMCEPTCDNPKPLSLFCPHIVCTSITRGCRCNNGYYRNNTGTCLLLENCSD
ncbi:hypothetical protein PV327_009206 [Microctonus hyperodae]|uniref:TIL domain-containing protein n=1 Tax=Microctonus hyperodae TaxID=165561 RepID=A0AA39FTJ8_MICHY|nr:hypothetical protein PV327_009206 [Microctonus hyperodae]